MKMRKILVLACLTLASCGPGPLMQPYQQQFESTFRTSVEIDDDPYSDKITYKGPEISRGNFSFHFLRSWKNKKSGAISHQLYVSDYYDSGGWKFWNRASSLGGDNLEFIQIDRDVGSCFHYTHSCTHTETFGISLSQDQLRAGLAHGLSVKIYSKSGDSLVISVPISVLQMQLSAVYGTAP